MASKTSTLRSTCHTPYTPHAYQTPHTAHIKHRTYQTPLIILTNSHYTEGENYWAKQGSWETGQKYRPKERPPQTQPLKDEDSGSDSGFGSDSRRKDKAKNRPVEKDEKVRISGPSSALSGPKASVSDPDLDMNMNRYAAVTVKSRGLKVVTTSLSFPYSASLNYMYHQCADLQTAGHGSNTIANVCLHCSTSRESPSTLSAGVRRLNSIENLRSKVLVLVLAQGLIRTVGSRGRERSDRAQHGPLLDHRTG